MCAGAGCFVAGLYKVEAPLAQSSLFPLYGAILVGMCIGGDRILARWGHRDGGLPGERSRACDAGRTLLVFAGAALCLLALRAWVDPRWLTPSWAGLAAALTLLALGMGDGRYTAASLLVVAAAATRGIRHDLAVGAPAYGFSLVAGVVALGIAAIWVSVWQRRRARPEPSPEGTKHE